MFINEAKVLGLCIQKYGTKDHIVEFSSEDKILRIFDEGRVSVNNKAADILAKNKHLTTKVLFQYKIPTTSPKIYKLKNLAINSLEAVGFPSVVKHNTQSCGKNVFAGISSEEEFSKVVARLMKNCCGDEEIIVEKYVQGKHYRIVMFMGEIVDILERIPAFVIGDGLNSIKTLIKFKNEKRARSGVTTNIKFNYDLFSYISKYPLKLTDIPDKGKRIRLIENCNFSRGGETHRINIGIVHSNNKDLFIQAAKAMGLSFCGIDFIIPDITKDYKKQVCAINEINSSPGLSANYFADEHENNIAIRKILKIFFTKE